eukprot:5564372-Prymnesium_polylepis.1
MTYVPIAKSAAESAVLEAHTPVNHDPAVGLLARNSASSRWSGWDVTVVWRSSSSDLSSATSECCRAYGHPEMPRAPCIGQAEKGEWVSSANIANIKLYSWGCEVLSGHSFPKMVSFGLLKVTSATAAKNFR